MKKFAFALTCFVLIISCGAFFTGCQSNDSSNSSEDNFIEVYSLTYITSNNNSSTRYSRYTVRYDNESIVEVNEDEFNAASNDYKIAYPYLTINISKDKSNLPKFNIGDYIYLYNYGYRKAICTDIEYQYLSVSIVDNRTIKIKSYDGSISVLSSDFYEIEYFNV